MPRRVSVVLLPDAELSQKMEADEKAKIAEFRKTLTQTEVGCRGLRGSEGTIEGPGQVGQAVKTDGRGPA